MFWNSQRGPLATVRGRLTLWHTLFLCAVLVMLFFAQHGLLRRRLRNRMDEDLRHEVREFQILYEEFGLAALADEFSREAETEGSDNVVMLFLSPNLVELASSDLTSWHNFHFRNADLANLQPGEVRVRFLDGRHDARMRLAENRLADGNFILLGASLRADNDLLAVFGRMFGLLAGGLLLAGVVSGWLAVSRAMTGVEQVTQTALQIGDADLESRIAPGNRGREIEDLVAAFNGMLDRIDRLVRELRQVSDDLSHDLRSSVTRVRGLLESALMHRQPAADALADAAGRAIEQCDQQVAMLNTMLDIAEANAGLATLARDAIDLVALTAQACELFRPLAEDRGIELRHQSSVPALMVRGDLARLQRAVANLLDNAIKYTPSGGKVAVRVDADGPLAMIVVTDTGIGIAPEDRERVFDRFYRADRSRTHAGNGLGLPLVRAIVRAHGGRVDLGGRPDHGSIFTVFLPREES